MSADVPGDAKGATPVSISAVSTALARPVKDAGQDLYDRAAPAVTTYFERLEDIVHEARNSRAAAGKHGDVTVETVLAALSGAKVMSSVPGRARLRVDALKGQTELAAATGQALVLVPGVYQASLNPLLGSLLITYDARRYKSLDALFAAAGPA